MTPPLLSASVLVGRFAVCWTVFVCHDSILILEHLFLDIPGQLATMMAAGPLKFSAASRTMIVDPTNANTVPFTFLSSPAAAAAAATAASTATKVNQANIVHNHNNYHQHQPKIDGDSEGKRLGDEDLQQVLR